MSTTCVNIKTEPEFNCVDQHEGDTEEFADAGYPKQALDLTKKNTIHNENEARISPEIQPEFVNIKMEVDCDDIIKEEPKSDSEEERNERLVWENNDIVVTQSQPVDRDTSRRAFEIAVKHEAIDESDCHSQPADRGNGGRAFQIDVKQEAVDEINSHDGHHFLEVRLTQPNTSYDGDDDGVSEELLCLNSTADGKFMCPICHKRFASKSNVQRHQLLHSKEKLECNICFRHFVKPAHLKKHILTHSAVRMYKCTECDKDFKTSSNLEQHKRTHLAVKPFKCEICFRQFAVKANLLKHQGRSRCKRPCNEPIICHVCNKVFEREFLLRSHLRRHTTEKPYTCETCDMSFKYKSTLIRHIQLHNGIKPYSCKICKKRFTHAGLIKPHMRKHTGEKPYPCPICSKLFAHKHNMERHTLRHAKIKHLVCDICNKKFPKESRLVYHMRTHTNAKPFTCKVCPKKFTHRQNVIRHYARKHPGEVYDSPETDASVAREAWESVIQRNLKLEAENSESNDEYVIP